MTYQEIIDSHYKKFIEDFAHTCSVNNKAWFLSKSDFSAFSLIPASFYEYKDKAKIVDVDFRNEMIIKTLLDLFDFFHIEYFCPASKNNFIVHYSGDSLRKYDEDHDFVFIINKIGYRFSGLIDGESEILLSKYALEKIVIINFSNSKSLFSNALDFEDFLKIFFSDDLIKYYFSIINKSSKEIGKLIDYSVVENLSFKKLSHFRNELISKINNFDLRNVCYEFGINNRNNHNFYGILESDIDILTTNIKEQKIANIIVGNNDFSKCFITSEYLYEIMKYQNHFDYTSVVCGYLKCIENLLFLFHLSSGEPIEMRYKTFKSKEQEEKYVEQHPNSIKVCDKTDDGLILYKIFLKKKYIEMGDLIDRLHKDERFWRLQKESRTAIYYYLTDFQKTCRNEHFHIDNIYSEKEVERIRNNTWLCMIYLLGGFNILNNAEIVLDSFDTRFNLIYEKFSQLPTSINKFIIEINGRKIKTIRPIYRDTAHYDSNTGIITSCIKLVVVDDFKDCHSIFHLTSFDGYETLCIDKDNIPDSIIWLTYDLKETKLEY